MTLTQKGTRAEAAAAATAEEFLKQDHKIIANDEEVKEYDENLDSENRERDIAEWIDLHRKQSSRNKDKEAEGKEGDVGGTQASKEDNSPIDE